MILIAVERFLFKLLNLFFLAISWLSNDGRIICLNVLVRKLAVLWCKSSTIDEVQNEIVSVEEEVIIEPKPKVKKPLVIVEEDNEV